MDVQVDHPMPFSLQDLGRNHLRLVNHDQGDCIHPKLEAYTIIASNIGGYLAGDKEDFILSIKIRG
jgi:hypothetical protein